VLVGCVVLGACGGGGPSTGPSEPDGLPAQPEPLSPVGGVQLTTDTPTLTVRNARGYDLGQAQYDFRVVSASGASELASVTAAAGSGVTSATVTTPLPRGMWLSWTATARGTAGETSSAPASFRGPGVECLGSSDPYAKSVVDWWLSACSLAHNIYNDPEAVLGPPDSRGQGPLGFTGFMSLGEGGYVTVDMQSCATDLPGADVRVFQRIGAEPVTLYAAGQPDGPFVLVEYRKRCGGAIPGPSNFCDFDLALGEIQQARYFRIQDGELYPCPGDTVSEGADIDAIEILNLEPAQ
jgi:hypothetical protein